MVPRLALIVKHLDYLQKLGVTAVYFSPLFESDTHGYDTADYFQIDRRLGDVKLFKQVRTRLALSYLPGLLLHHGAECGRRPAARGAVKKQPACLHQKTTNY